MASRKYELASAYVRIMPSLEGVAQAVSKEMAKGLKNGVNEAPLEQSVQKKVGQAVNNLKLADLGSQLFSNASAAIAPLNSALISTIRGAGVLFSDTLTAGAQTAGLAITGAIAAIGGQVAVGGFNRALGINEATAGLKAMGFEGQRFTAIMTAAGNAVDGTAYSMDQSVLAARNFMAAGVPEAKLESYLKNVGKLADMGTRTYDDISVMLQSMAATGIVQGGDMLQLAQAGIPIFTALADTLGVSVEEVKKLGSEGKISFDRMNDAISGIDWNSSLFAATDVSAAFGNVRAQLSKVGANIWEPIIDKLPSILNDARAFISIFGKTFDFNPLQTSLSASMDKIGSVFDRFKNAEGSLDPEKVKTYVTSVTAQFSGLADKLDAYKGVIAGALIGMGGSYLSTIPIIGPAFARVTPLVGAFAGVLVAAYQNSEKLQEAVRGLGGLWDSVKGKLFSGLDGLGGEDIFSTIGDGLAEAIFFMQDLIIDTIGGLKEYMPEIKATIETIFSYIGDAFKTASENGLDGEAVAALFTQLIKLFGTYAPLAFEVILTAAAMAGEIVKSEWFNGLIDFIAGMFLSISQSGGLIESGLQIAAAIFIGSKLIPVISGIIGFITAFKTIAPAADVAAKAAPVVAVSMKGVLLGVVKIVAVAALIIAAMVGLGYLMQETGFMDHLNTFLSQVLNTGAVILGGLAHIVDTVLPTVQAFLLMINTVVTDFIGGLVSAILEPLGTYIELVGSVITDVNNSVSELTEARAGLIDAQAGYADSIGHLLRTMANYGAEAGVGAYAAAGGIAALMSAIALGSVANSGASFLDSTVGALTGKGGSSPISDLMQVVFALTELQAITTNLPATFNTALAQSMAFGMQIPTVIANGILSGAPAVASALNTVLSSALQSQQAYLDANPLTVRLTVDDSSLRAANASQGSGGSTTVNNRTNNYQLSSSNDAVINRLLDDGRGF